jgi:hypothetical protein
MTGNNPTQSATQGYIALMKTAIIATRVLYANLAKALFARLYAKSLIPRLGTLFSWLEYCSVSRTKIS